MFLYLKISTTVIGVLRRRYASEFNRIFQLSTKRNTNGDAAIIHFQSWLVVNICFESFMFWTCVRFVNYWIYVILISSFILFLYKFLFFKIYATYLYVLVVKTNNSLILFNFEPYAFLFLSNTCQVNWSKLSDIDVMQVTRTERGITTRQLIFALRNGKLFSIIRKFFDPRRPLHPGPSDRLVHMSSCSLFRIIELGMFNVKLYVF